MRVTRAAHLKCPATQTIQGVNSTIFPSHPISESPFEPTSLQKACKGTVDWYQYGAALPHGSNILGQKRFNGHDGDLKCRQQVSGNTLLPEEQLRILAVKAAANSGTYQTSTLPKLQVLQAMIPVGPVIATKPAFIQAGSGTRTSTNGARKRASSGTWRPAPPSGSTQSL